MRKTYVHVGAGKCGSSSIQSYFSKSPHHNINETTDLEYCAIGKNGLLSGDQILARRPYRLEGYISSNPEFIQDSAVVNNVAQRISGLNNDILLSCETWMPQLEVSSQASRLVDVWSGNSSRELVLFMFVRPPVSWLSSAWWQWGVWSKRPFERWLKQATNHAKWAIRYMNMKILDHPVVTGIKILPVRANVVHQLADCLGIGRDEMMDKRSNTSLPFDILSLYLHHPELRPAPHTSLLDFIASRALARRSVQYTKPPLGLTVENVKWVIEETQESNNLLLEMLAQEDREFVREDPAWWSAEHYSSSIRTLHEAESSCNYRDISIDLLLELRRAYRKLAKHGLLLDDHQ